MEAEARGEGETLYKHKKALLRIAEKQGLAVVCILEELESAESIIHRPEMVKLLKAVESGEYGAVLCMDIDRLGRGRAGEQELILDTFKNSRTKIITPRKTYDLTNEWDEEYSEFEAFMARKEYKIINRRLQRGRVAAVEEGNYIGTIPPFGYLIKKTPTCRYLVPHPEQAHVVKIIFDSYANKGMGAGKIANELNILGYKTYTGGEWRSHSVLGILKNAVYCGRVQWKKKEAKKNAAGRREVRTRPQEEWVDVEGKHEPLVSPELFQKAQDVLSGRTHPAYRINGAITNPLAGIIICGVCGFRMVYRPYGNKEAHIICYNKCGNKSSKFKYVEETLLSNLKKWIQDRENAWEESRPEENMEADIATTTHLKKEISELTKQREKLFDLLERGIYEEETYLERAGNIDSRLSSACEKLKQMEKKKRKKPKLEIPKLQTALDAYFLTNNAEQKNRLLKTILVKAVYIKEKSQKDDDFRLDIFPRV